MREEIIPLMCVHCVRVNSCDDVLQSSPPAQPPAGTSSLSSRFCEETDEYFAILTQTPEVPLVAPVPACIRQRGDEELS